jgi:hypothetical protein
MGGRNAGVRHPRPFPTGWILGPLRIWEGPLLGASAIGIFFTNTGWHGDARYPLLFMLVAMVGLSIRVIRGGAFRQIPLDPKPQAATAS